MNKFNSRFWGAVAIFVGVVLIVLALPFTKGVALGIIWGSGVLLYLALWRLTKKS